MTLSHPRQNAADMLHGGAEVPSFSSLKSLHHCAIVTRFFKRK